MRMRRWTGFGAAAALTTVVVVLAGGLAWADRPRLMATASSRLDEALSFGNVCANTTVTKDVLCSRSTAPTNGTPEHLQEQLGRVAVRDGRRQRHGGAA